MVSHSRIVKLNGQHPPPQIQLMFGDAIGHWDGNTLVVETTNFHPMHMLYAHPLFHSPTSKVTERFTRYSATELLYEFTVEDPTLYTQVWRGELVFNALEEPIFEYACHEGNLSMPGILMGARVQERAKN